MTLFDEIHLPECASIAEFDSGYPIVIKVQKLGGLYWELLGKEETMRNEETWNTFTRTGRVADYLAYVGYGKRQEESGNWKNAEKEERGQREGTSDGNGAFGSYHW